MASLVYDQTLITSLQKTISASLQQNFELISRVHRYLKNFLRLYFCNDINFCWLNKKLLPTNELVISFQFLRLFDLNQADHLNILRF